MNSILLSLKPRFCSLIISGAKTLEIRKNHPAVELPFKVYVYCSERNTRTPHHILKAHTEGKIHRCNGRIIGEFICEGIVSSNDSPHSNYSALEEGSCLSSQELNAYGRGKTLYGWRISSFHLRQAAGPGNPLYSRRQTYSSSTTKLVLCKTKYVKEISKC